MSGHRCGITFSGLSCNLRWGHDGDHSTDRCWHQNHGKPGHTCEPIHPAPQPTAQPTVEQVALAIHRVSDMQEGESACECDVGDVKEINEWDLRVRQARAVLALPPGRPESVVKAEALREVAADIDAEAAKDAALDRLADVRCYRCELRYAEREQYSCHEYGAHSYDASDVAEASEVRIVPTYDGDQLRARADRIESP